LKSRGFVGGSKWPSTDFQGLDLSGWGPAKAAIELTLRLAYCETLANATQAPLPIFIAVGDA